MKSAKIKKKKFRLISLSLDEFSCLPRPPTAAVHECREVCLRLCQGERNKIYLVPVRYREAILGGYWEKSTRLWTDGRLRPRKGGATLRWKPVRD